MIVKILLIYLVIIVATAFLGISNVSSAYGDYDNTKTYYEENDITDEGENSDFTYDYNSDTGVSSVTNPLAYHFDRYNKAVFALSPKYFSQQCAEVGILIFPIIMFLFGQYLAVRDVKSKTYRYTFVRYGQKNSCLSKMTVLVGAVILSAVFITLVSLILSFGLYSYVQKSNFGYTENFTVDLTVSFAVKLLVQLLIMLMYSSVGFLTGAIFSNLAVGSVIGVVYIYIVPCFAKFDLKNSTYILMKKTYDFIGFADISKYKSGSSAMAVMIILTAVVASNLLSYLIITKKKYN
jgi:hypothetical protein